LFVAREILEIGVEYSVAREDVPAFERYMAMLKTYYMDYSDKLEESPKKFELLGLNLLRLLSQNEIAKFHTELELLDPSTIQENPYISCPVKLEQDIMEGSYRKVSNLWFNIMKIVLSFMHSEITF
jgi:26S proteasome regulatory subunit N12